MVEVFQTQAHEETNLRTAKTAITFNRSVDAAQIKYQQARVLHWNTVARKLETWTGWGGYYHRRLTQVYQFLVAPGQSILELGCGRGDPDCCTQARIRGWGGFFGGDDSRGNTAAPQLRFVHADVHVLDLTGKFDVIILRLT